MKIHLKAPTVMTCVNVVGCEHVEFPAGRECYFQKNQYPGWIEYTVFTYLDGRKFSHTKFEYLYPMVKLRDAIEGGKYAHDLKRGSLVVVHGKHRGEYRGKVLAKGPTNGLFRVWCEDVKATFYVDRLQLVDEREQQPQPKAKQVARKK